MPLESKEPIGVDPFLTLLANSLCGVAELRHILILFSWTQYQGSSWIFSLQTDANRTARAMLTVLDRILDPDQLMVMGINEGSSE